MENNKLNKAREFLVEEFMNCLNEDKLPWEKGWTTVDMKSFNPITKTRYQGINALILMLSSIKYQFNDPRWCTFKQASANGWKVKKDSKGTPVEFWSFYDKVNKQQITPEMYNYFIKHDKRDPKEFRMVARVYTVFNASQLEGIPPHEVVVEKMNNVEMNDFINSIKNNLGVKYREYGNSAHYSPSQDEVVMPPRQAFKNQNEFDSTLLHELAHSTGHVSRLGRNLVNSFGSREYAIEELNAEMTAVFMGQHMDIEMSESHLNNHKAYIQSWCEVIKNDSKVLFNAIKEAKKIADYLIDKGETKLVKE